MCDADLHWIDLSGKKMSQTTSGSCDSFIHSFILMLPICSHGVTYLAYEMHLNNLQKQDDSCVGHGVRQSQDSTSHDRIAQVEDGHPERGFPFKL